MRYSGDQRGGRQRSLVSNDGVYLVADTTRADRRLLPVMTEHDQQPSSSRCHVADYTRLRKTQKPTSGTSASLSVTTYETASCEEHLERTRMDPLGRTGIPKTLSISERAAVKAVKSAPAAKYGAVVPWKPLYEVPLYGSHGEPPRRSRRPSDVSAGRYSRGRSFTPGNVRETPRYLVLHTPHHITSESLYLSWKEYFRTPDPLSRTQLFDSIKMDVPASILQFLEEAEMSDRSFSTVSAVSRATGEGSFLTTPASDPAVVPLLPPPKPAPDSILVINVGGENFLIKRSLLKRYPRSLLGSAELERYFVRKLGCYFFDRSRFLFEHILQIYQCGNTNLLPGFLQQDINVDALKREFAFFKLNMTFKILERQETSQTFNPQREEGDDMINALFESQGWGKLQQAKLKLYIFLMNPQSSFLAMVWTFVDIILVTLSIALLIIASEPGYAHHFLDHESFSCKLKLVTELASHGFFTIDFLLRLVSWPRLRTFFKSGMNLCDLVSLLPFYIPHLIKLLDQNVKSLIVLRVIRMFRIARVFRVIRHSHGLTIIFQFLLNSTQEMILMAGLFGILVLLFGSLMYFTEDHAGSFHSIPASAWWAVVSLTSIGYGDVVPRTVPGKLVAVTAIMTGVIFLALPMTIIITKFTKHMERHYRY